MSCKDLDQLLASSAAPSTWSAEAQEHLKSCSRCSPLRDVMEHISSEVVDEMLQARLEASIIPGLTAVSPLPSVARVAASLIIMAGVVVVLANWHLGTAGWHARSVFQLCVNFTLLGVSLWLVAKALAARMMPGSGDTKPILVYVTVPLVALLTTDVVLFGYAWNQKFFPIALSCWEIGVTCAAISAPLFWVLLRRGFWLNRIAQGATTGLLAGLVGVTVLEIYCPYLDRLHIGAAHIGAAITAALVGAAFGAVMRKLESRRQR